MQLKFLILAICVSATLARQSPPGKNYNPHRAEVSGHREISLLGTFNGTNIYYGSDFVTQNVARIECEAAGLKLGTFDQALLNYIFSVTSSEEDLSWTSGTHHYGHSAFEFEDSSSVPTDIDLNGQTRYLPSYGLIIDRVSDNTALRIWPSSGLRPFLCYIEA